MKKIITLSMILLLAAAMAQATAWFDGSFDAARAKAQAENKLILVDTLNLVGGFWIDPIRQKFSFPAPPYADTTSFSEIEVSVTKVLQTNAGRMIFAIPAH